MEWYEIWEIRFPTDTEWRKMSRNLTGDRSRSEWHIKNAKNFQKRISGVEI